MKSELISLAKEQKISKIGFCSLADYIKHSNSNCPKVFEKELSIIVCAFGYYNGNREGNISKYARGIDYHIIAKQKMQALVEFLHKSGYSAESYADIGELDERLLAQLSGIASRGRNTMAISEGLGSYFFIGYILTDCVLSPNKMNTDICANCGACIKACPMGALTDNGFIKERCLSYITQKKGELADNEISAMQKHNIGWGCDICQDVCPHNKNIAMTDIEEFKTDLIYNLDVDESISNKEFKKIYKNRAFAWRGKTVLIRNQHILKDKIKKD